MNPAKEIIQQIVQVFQKKGIEHIVISPGSRNAPIADAFINHSSIKCYSIVDERSAAFFALGIAQQSGKTVALLCTSGTAVLNYAPAIAEAYYQKVPLLVITADRPLEMVNQGESQTINQRNIYSNYVKGAFDLLQNPSDDNEKAYNLRLISNAVNETQLGNQGPVQLNFSISEPLYEQLPSVKNPLRTIDVEPTSSVLSASTISKLKIELQQTTKVMVLVGSMTPNPAFEVLLEELSQRSNIIVLTETTGNLSSESFVQNIDRVLAVIGEDERNYFNPDLLITISDQVISKKIKYFIREKKPLQHWHVDPSQLHFDTYQCLTNTIPVKPFYFLEKVLDNTHEEKPSEYRSSWIQKRDLAANSHKRYIEKLGWCDLKVFEIILEQIPDGTVLQMGNSSPVRYIQLFDQNPKLTYFSNRGTSGIEGCTSTAVGASMVGEKSQLLITGELGFMYDSNGLWNNYLSKRLKIIVINNGGGGIFRIIEGPDSVPQFETYISTEHDMRVEKLVRAHGLQYFSAENDKGLEAALIDFFSTQHASVLEIFTPKTENAIILRDYFKYLKNGTAN